MGKVLSLRAFYDPKVKSRNLVTTITGILLTLINVVVSVLLATNRITGDQAQPLTDSLIGIVTAGANIAGYISSIILMFRATDGSKTRTKYLSNKAA